MNYEGIYREKEGATGLIKRPRKLWLTVSTVREIGRLQRSIRVLASMTNAIRILRTNCFDLFDETAADFPPVHRINSIHCFTEILSPLYLCTLIRYCFTFYLGPFLLFHLSLFFVFSIINFCCFVDRRNSWRRKWKRQKRNSKRTMSWSLQSHNSKEGEQFR